MDSNCFHVLLLLQGNQMKPFDWIVLVIAIPMFLLSAIGRLHASQHPLVKAGVATPKVKAWQVYMWLVAILFIVWRVYG